jgi:hypothetical protein
MRVERSYFNIEAISIISGMSRENPADVLVLWME